MTHPYERNEVAGKQSGGSKRPRGDKAKLRGQRCFARAQQAHAENDRAQEKRHAANLASSGLTPWQLSLQARVVRRAILASAWASSPWRPGDAVNREKSVHEWIVAHKQPDPQMTAD